MQGHSCFRVSIVALALLVAQGCAWQAQSVRVQPSVSVGESNVGAGKSVAVNVVDERPSQNLGTRGVQGVGAEITIEGNLAETIQASVSDGLAKKGFKTENGALPRELRVEIRSFDYKVTQGFWEGTLTVNFGIKGICIKDGLRPYEMLYRGDFKKGIQVVQGEKSNEQYINIVVSDAVTKLLNDEALLACLAG